MNETSRNSCNSMVFGQGGANASRESGRKEDRRIDIRTTNSEEIRRRIRRVTDLSMPKLMVCCLHDGDNDDNDNDDDGKSNDKTHLHIFPPHVLPDPIRIASEALSGNGKIVCFVLKGIKSFLAFYNFGDIVSHDVDCVINLCLNGSGLGIRPSVSNGSRGIG